MPGPATGQLGHHPTSNWPTPRCTTTIPASTVAAHPAATRHWPLTHSTQPATQPQCGQHSASWPPGPVGSATGVTFPTSASHPTDPAQPFHPVHQVHLSHWATRPPAPRDAPSMNCGGIIAQSRKPINSKLARCQHDMVVGKTCGDTNAKPYSVNPSCREWHIVIPC